MIDERIARLSRWCGLQPVPPEGLRASEEFERVLRGQTLAIIGSHTTAAPEMNLAWRTDLQRALLYAAETGRTVVCSPQYAIGRWAVRFSSALGCQVVTLARAGTPCAAGDQGKSQLMLRPIGPPQAASLPPLEMAAVALADQLWVLGCRDHSKTEAAIAWWLKRTVQGTVLITDRIERLASKMQTLMIEQAIAAKLRVVCGRTGLASRSESFSAADRLPRVVSNEPSVTWPVMITSRQFARRADDRDGWLIHCTRGRCGALTRQTEHAYIAELLTAVGDLDDSPLATLERILKHGVLAATSDVKAGSVASISLSAVPLAELLARRQYRSGRHRWDWEPYGLAIRRRLIERLGGREVIYADPAEYRKLPAMRRWFYQSSDTARGNDWQQEREWRLPQDLRLSHVDWCDLAVFVPTEVDAQRIAPICRFPIILIGERDDFVLSDQSASKN